MLIRRMCSAAMTVLLWFGCSEGGETASTGTAGAGSSGQGGMTGSGGGLSGNLHVGFGNVDSSVSYDTFDSMSIGAVWNLTGYGSLTAFGPEQAGQCQQWVGLTFGGLPQSGATYTLDAPSDVPAGGKGSVTYNETCSGAGTHETWRSTMGTLTINTVTGETVSFTLEGLSLAPDTNVSPNDAMGTCVASGQGTARFVGLP